MKGHARVQSRYERPAPPLFPNALSAEEFDRNWTRGPFKLYPRTDGAFALCDMRRPIGGRTITVARDLMAAARMLREAWTAESDRVDMAATPKRSGSVAA
jgi:hypothetical protein